MLEKFVIVGFVSFAIVGLAIVAASLHHQIRMKRHLSRLKRIPLEKWND